MNQLSKMQQCSLIGVVHDPNTDGYFNPEVVKYRQLCAKSQQRRQLYSLQQYYHRLLKQILVSRKVRNAKNVGSTVQQYRGAEVGLNICSRFRSYWILQYTTVWTFHQRERYRQKVMLKYENKRLEEDCDAF